MFKVCQASRRSCHCCTQWVQNGWTCLQEQQVQYTLISACVPLCHVFLEISCTGQGACMLSWLTASSNLTQWKQLRRCKPSTYNWKWISILVGETGFIPPIDLYWFFFKSFLAEHDIPNLNTQSVAMVRAWVVHNLEGPYVWVSTISIIALCTQEECKNNNSSTTNHFNWWLLHVSVSSNYWDVHYPTHFTCRESCASNSLKVLDNMVRAKGLKFECQDNPAWVTCNLNDNMFLIIRTSIRHACTRTSLSQFIWLQAYCSSLVLKEPVLPILHTDQRTG